MKNYLFHVGIDISKLKLDINLLDSQTLQSEHFVIDNNSKSIKEFVKLLIKRKIESKYILFCCENTGIFTNHLIQTLLGMELNLCVVPAIEIKRSKGISRGKNDKTDAKDISFYSFRNTDKLRLYTMAEIDIQKLKNALYRKRKSIKIIVNFGNY